MTYGVFGTRHWGAASFTWRALLHLQQAAAVNARACKF